jgi:phosphoribosylformimino-5-aminoimidazole carboxamide ribonucleotide (ProFAR) isomerase
MFESIKIYALIAAAIVAAGVASCSSLQASSAEKALKKCGEDKAALATELELQNRAVQDWQNRAKAAQDAASQALASAKVANQALDATSRSLQARILAGKEVTCAPAVAEIRRMLK